MTLALETHEALAVCFACMTVSVGMVFYLIVRQNPERWCHQEERCLSLHDLADAELMILELYEDAEEVSPATTPLRDPYTQQKRLVRRTAKVRHRQTGEVSLRRLLLVDQD